MGFVFDIQRCSYHDGPGIRTTVFLKGCQLRCAWCHNPESFTLKPQLQYLTDQCISCQMCLKVCPNQVHAFENQIHKINFPNCTACGKCTSVCPTSALSMIGKEMSSEEVLFIVMQDKAFYEASGGGITISGGEPTLQPSFLLELLTLSKDNGLHTCLETNGYISAATLMSIVPMTDLFLLDFKATDQEVLKNCTQAEGGLWDNTLSYLQEMNKPVILRMPIIPGVNDKAEHFERAKALRRGFPIIQQIEIMPYHSMGSGKWSRIGLTYSLSDLPSATSEQASFWRSLVED